MPFIGRLPALMPGPDGVTFRLTADLCYQGATEGMTVPAGFVTDLASVPRPVQWLVPRAGAYDWAAVVHDYLCTTLEAGRPVTSPVDTDGVFRRLMRELGVPVVLRWLMWAGVRWGAALTPARRPGWWTTAPLVALITVLALPLVAPATVLVAAGLLLLAAAEATAALPGRHRNRKEPAHA